MTWPEAVAWIVIVGLFLWGVRHALHAELDRRARQERLKREQDEAVRRAIENIPKGSDDGD